MQQRLTDPWTRTVLVTSEVKNVKLINWAGFCALYGVVSEWKPVLEPSEKHLRRGRQYDRGTKIHLPES